ncbi:MAG: TetR/AcrR family transcriptional regulator [Candidatus Nitrosomaritimum yanchengensis]
MRSNGIKTRNRILTAAQDLILQQGFSGTPIDQIIENSAVTKGGFFYHFEGKRDLAKHLLIRFLEEDQKIFDELVDRSKSLSEDPLQQVLIFLNLYAELACELPTGHPGCLVASYTYELQQFDPEIYQIAKDGMQVWKDEFEALLQSITDKHPPVTDINLGDVAEMLTAVFEGGIILSKISGEPCALSKQLLQFRTYIRFIFGDVKTN